MRLLHKILSDPWFDFKLSLLIVLFFLYETLFHQSISSIVIMFYWIGWSIQKGLATRREIIDQKVIQAQQDCIIRLLDLATTPEQLAH